MARKCIEQGKPMREFKSEIIPAAELARIGEALKACKTVEDVEAAFKRVDDPILALAAEIREARRALLAGA